MRDATFPCDKRAAFYAEIVLKQQAEARWGRCVLVGLQKRLKPFNT
ncbi:hypothetical protein [Bradyrhizobium sp. LTSPM299]|nr:hypothetical protein [Bradyrhizobium sp. LTSPM299]